VSEQQVGLFVVILFLILLGNTHGKKVTLMMFGVGFWASLEPNDEKTDLSHVMALVFYT
jgi:hypothetical protein